MDLIIFDCDGVLVDSETICHREIARLLAAEAVGLEAGAYIAASTGRREDEIMDAILAACGVRLPPGFPERVVRAIDAALAGEVTAIPGVAAALTTLTLPKAVASNSPPTRLEHSLRRAGLRHHFGPHVFSAALVARPKPAPDLYRLVAFRLETPPERCLVIEDGVAGVQAAVAAGMAVLGFLGASHVRPGHGEVLRAAGAVGLVESMAALPAQVAAMAGR